MNSSYFDEVFDRYHSDSARYDLSSSILPLTVADTDFRSSPKVIEALKRRLDHPLFGYVKEEEGWKKSVCYFYQKRFHLGLNPAELAFSTGVLAAVTAFLRSFSSPGDSVLLLSPVYNTFFSAIAHTGRKVDELCILDKKTNGYHIDFDSLERKMGRSKAMILCSPHNPLGLIYKEEDLRKIFLLAKKHEVRILSDEIHALLSFAPFTPSLSFDEAKEVVIMAASPSKAFNTAGIHSSFVASKSKALLEKISAQLGYDDCGEPNAFAQGVLEAAYGDEDYLDSLLDYLKGNIAYLHSALDSSPYIRLGKIEATYLCFLDCTSFLEDEEEFLLLLEKNGLRLSPGSLYGLGGKGHLRLNFATPRGNLEKAMKILLESVEEYLGERG